MTDELQNELMMEDCKATWREEARARAEQDVKDEGIFGEASEEFFQERMRYHYAELERLALENLR